MMSHGLPLADSEVEERFDVWSARAAIEYYESHAFTDGLPVVPVSESSLAAFLRTVDRDPQEVLMPMPHLNRALTVRLAAINAAMAGCLPEYFPVVVAAWEGFAAEPTPTRGIWQSTTGTAPLTLVNGPIRDQIGINCAGNIFGSGFRANATIGRAIRLAAINVFGLHPHLLDQATQATPAKYSACLGENEENSPWESLHVQHGFDSDDSTVSTFVIRSVLHLEARHCDAPEQLGHDLANSVARTGALLHEYTSSLIVLGPEHAAMCARAGWDKDTVRRFVYEAASVSRATLARVGKGAVSRHSRWRLPADHPDAIADETSARGGDDAPVLSSLDAIQVIVAGADNAGVSAVVDLFGPPRGIPFSIAKVRSSA
ncbi:hypothetical protein GCM10009808_11970 [Microbacterium sediminicola]|uniref:MmgE/PrpD family protein n=1 Tax=Microbacterium sediminicola TaxID=415210 RepID=A0ABN2I0G7_9MICO